jgi:pimeloyl-ACP methyl ester carboxylesterase
MRPRELESFRTTHACRTAPVGDVVFEYWGGGQGPRGLLVLGGAASFGDSSYRLISLFEGSRRVISPSYPLVGTVAELCDGLARLLDRERLDKVDVFGHSLGAGFAHVFARLYPDRVERLALESFGLYGPFHRWAAKEFYQAMRLLPNAALRGYYRHAFDRLAHQAAPARALELYELADDLLARQTRELMLGHLELLVDLFSKHDGYKLHEPYSRSNVMLLFANDDHGFTRKEQEALTATYPHASVVRFVSTGHLLGATHAQELEHKLELFFRPRAFAPLAPAQAG